MRSCRDRATIVIKPGFWLVLAVCLLVVPLKLILAWLIAAGFHELCHIVALNCCHVRIYGIRIGFLSMQIETEPLSNRVEFICAFAGPAGSCLLICLHKFIPTIAFFAFIQAISNLLPAENRDGSRMMRCVFVKCFGTLRGMELFHLVTVALKCFLYSAFAFFCLAIKFILPILLLALIHLIKIPCKARKQIVQY